LSAKALYKAPPVCFHGERPRGAFHATGINILWNISEYNEKPKGNLNDAIARDTSKRCATKERCPNVAVAGH